VRRMQVDATGERFQAERVAELPIHIVFEQKHRHLHRPALPQGHAVFAHCASRPSRKRWPLARICPTASTASSFRILAIAAAIDTLAVQKEPVVKMRVAPSRKRSLPVTAASAWPLAIALLQAAMSGRTPTGSQLPPISRRKPARTSSTNSAASAPSAPSRKRRSWQFMRLAKVVPIWRRKAAAIAAPSIKAERPDVGNHPATRLRQFVLNVILYLFFAVVLPARQPDRNIPRQQLFLRQQAGVLERFEVG